MGVTYVINQYVSITTDKMHNVLYTFNSLKWTVLIKVVRSGIRVCAVWFDLLKKSHLTKVVSLVIDYTSCVVWFWVTKNSHLVIHSGIRLVVLYAIDSLKRVSYRSRCFWNQTTVFVLSFSCCDILFCLFFNRQLITAPIGRIIHLHVPLTLTVNNSVKVFYLNETHPQTYYEKNLGLIVVKSLIVCNVATSLFAEPFRPL